MSSPPSATTTNNVANDDSAAAAEPTTEEVERWSAIAKLLDGNEYGEPGWRIVTLNSN